MTSPRRISQSKQPLVSVGTARAFRATVIPAQGDTYGLRLDETFGGKGQTLAVRVVSASPAQAGRVIDAVFAAVRASGHAPSSLAFNRQAPIRLDEPDGARLALILLTTQPVAKHNRVRALVAGVNSMSIEETYYWYSKCIGVDASRALRALRTLLADD